MKLKDSPARRRRAPMVHASKQVQEETGKCEDIAPDGLKWEFISDLHEQKIIDLNFRYQEHLHLIPVKN